MFDPDKLIDAEEMEESDTFDGISIITWRSCLCDNTHDQWKRDEVVYSESNIRMLNSIKYSDSTSVMVLPGNQVRVFPKWSIESNIKIQKRGFLGIWHPETYFIEFSRGFNLTHTYSGISNGLLSDGSWYNDVSITTGFEGDYHNNATWTYNSYDASVYSWIPLGYCIAVRRFQQSGSITNPTLTNSFAFYPFPFPDFSGYHGLAPSISCPPSDVLYF